MLFEKKNLLFTLSLVIIFSLIVVRLGNFSGYAILNKCYSDCDKGLNTCKPLVEASFVLCRNAADINYKNCREKEYTTCQKLDFKTCLKPRLESCFLEWKREIKQCESNAELAIGSCSNNLIACAEKCK